MPDLELLSSQLHAGLRVAAPAARGRHFIPIVLAEFERVAARSPIFFCKNAETGEFYAGTVLGFKPGETVALDASDSADADQLFDVVRAGFYIVQDDIAIDPQHARFGSGVGEALFEDGDRPATALRRVQRALGQLHAGLGHTETFLKRLLALKLIEPIDLSFQFDDGDRLVLDGLYTISRDALADIDDAVAVELFRDGHLAAIYAVIASLHHMTRLARIRNDSLSAG
ncbi:SapC family protein [Sphingomonas sp. PAMC 26605]|uniref:SapC family protein n=1 Tax=Sphingomonas sp. PAMC 26605 TaxID=1112214 RepID=UPI00026CDD57|nr:SapC family protein [Sphingomonas sp. PAMC 26605]